MSCLQRFCTSGATRIAERRSRGFIAVPFPMFPPLINEGVAARPFFPPDKQSGRKEKTIERCRYIKNNRYYWSAAIAVLLRRRGFERNCKKIVCDCFAGIVIACKRLCSATLCAGLLYTTRKCEISPYYGKKQGYWRVDVSKSCHAQVKRRKTGKISSHYASQMLMAAIFREKTHLRAITASKQWRQRMKSVTKSARYTTRRLRGSAIFEAANNILQLLCLCFM